MITKYLMFMNHHIQISSRNVLGVIILLSVRFCCWQMNDLSLSRTQYDGRFSLMRCQTRTLECTINFSHGTIHSMITTPLFFGDVDGLSVQVRAWDLAISRLNEVETWKAELSCFLAVEVLFIGIYSSYWLACTPGCHWQPKGRLFC